MRPFMKMRWDAGDPRSGILSNADRMLSGMISSGENVFNRNDTRQLKSRVTAGSRNASTDP